MSEFLKGLLFGQIIDVIAIIVFFAVNGWPQF